MRLARLRIWRNLFGGALLLALTPECAGAADAYSSISGRQVSEPRDEVAAWPIDAETTVHVVRSRAFLLSTREHEGLFRLTTLPSSGPGGGLEAFHPPWVGSFEIRPTERLRAFVFQVYYGSGSHRFADGKAHLGVCVLREGRPEGRCQEWQVGTSDYYAYRYNETDTGVPRKTEWLYNAVDSSAPGRYSATCPVVSDQDSDGYADILLWRRHYSSKSVDEYRRAGMRGDEWTVDSQELSWLRFDPERHLFKERPAAPGTEAPASSICPGGP